jgi:hypothetical protein
LDLIILTRKPRSVVSNAYRSLEDFFRGRRWKLLSQVSRSLIYGLAQQNDISWRHISNYSGQIAKAIYVIHDHDCTRIAIEAKKNGLCQRLLVGPDGVLAAKEIDGVISPSEWWRDHIERTEPSLAGRSIIWAAGVDPDFWVQAGTPRRRKVLVYDKKRRADADRVDSMLRANGYDTIVVRYGSYTLEAYRAALSDCFANVVVASSESQGISLAESWAMDVPTLVARCDSTDRFFRCSAAPYLTDQTGRFWSSETELVGMLASMEGYRPRRWVLENNTDKIAARNFIRVALDPAN